MKILSIKQSIRILLLTRKHSNRMRTACFCGLRVRYAPGYLTSTPRYPTPRYPTPQVPYLPIYPIPRILYPLDTLLQNGHGTGDTLTSGRNMGPEIPYPKKGHGTKDQEGTWHQRYPTPRKDMRPGTRERDLASEILSPLLPTVDRMTDSCENITFPQLLLRAVISKVWGIRVNIKW